MRRSKEDILERFLVIVEANTSSNRKILKTNMMQILGVSTNAINELIFYCLKRKFIEKVILKDARLNRSGYKIKTTYYITNSGKDCINYFKKYNFRYLNINTKEEVKK